MKLALINAPTFSFRLYMPSIRCVTRKPPKMFTLASISAMKPKKRAKHGPLPDEIDADGEQRADHDHRRDGVGDAHQRRVERRRHRPHHVIADEDRQHEDRQPEDERDRSRRRTPHAPRRLPHRARASWPSAICAACSAALCACSAALRRGLRRVLRLSGPPGSVPRCPSGRALLPQPRFGANAGLMIAPSAVSSVAATISSSRLMSSAFVSLSIIGSTKA